MAERRLAIAIKGGVSLGAYEAGVIAETLYLLDYNNKRNSVKWYVDTLAGASAGGMTAAVLATILLNGSLAGNTVNQSLLRTVWVDAISLDILAPNAGTGLNNNFLFDSSALDRIAGKYIKYPATISQHSTLRNASAGDGAHIALALTHSRLGQGLNSVPGFNRAEFMFNEHAALSRFDIRVKPDGAGNLVPSFAGTGASSPPQPNDGTTLDSMAAFSGMIACAIACGSFPFAFAPRKLALMDDQKNWTADYFTDGGVFNNDPVGQVINLAHEIDWGPDAENFSDTERRYLMIEPEPPQDPDNWPSNPQLVAGTDMLDVDPWQMIGRIVGGALEEIQQSGIRGIPEVNRRVQARQKVIGELEYYMHTASGDLSVPPWLPNIVNTLGTTRSLTLTQLNYFRSHFIDDLEIEAPVAYGGARSLPADRQQLFVELGLLADLAIDVADKVAFDPILVNPASQLAGDPLYAFKGFFDVNIRKHDFAQGVADAFNAWRDVASLEPTQTLVLPSGDAPSVPTVPPANYSNQMKIVQNRLDAIVNSAVNATTLSGITKDWIEFQIKFVLADLIKTLS